MIWISKYELDEKLGKHYKRAVDILKRLNLSGTESLLIYWVLDGAARAGERPPNVKALATNESYLRNYLNKLTARYGDVFPENRKRRIHRLYSR